MQTTTNLLRISNATMAKGRWSRSEENVAIEAYSVLMAHEKPNRTLTKADLLSAMAQPNIYQDFLKLCLECRRRFSEGPVQPICRSHGPVLIAEV